MKIITITNNSLENCQFSSVEITAQLRAWNKWRVAIKGALSRKSRTQGTLDLYFLGKASVIAGQGIVIINESLENKVQYSILSIPYLISPTESYQVNVLLDLEEPYLQENESFASIYLGDKRISKELISSNIWENSIQIKTLKFQLLYPKILPADYIRPLPQKIASSTEEETKNMLKEYFGEDIFDWGLKKWLVQSVKKTTPFILGFPTISEIAQEEINKMQDDDLKNKEKKNKKGCFSFLTSTIIILIGIILLLIILF